MYQGHAQTDVSSRSELLSSLKVYLNNKNRLQPIIGLGSITECVKVGAYKRETVYLCEVCVCRLSKADIRNHIIGSLHRYNYIKAFYPSLVHEWQENSDLSELAWPLMAIAKTVEGKEGAGVVQLLEVDDAVYQKMATDSEIDAITTMNFLKDWQCEPENDSENTSVQLEYNSIQSVKNVFLAQQQWKWAEKSLTADKISPQTSKWTYMPPSLMQSSVPPTQLESLSKSTSESQLHNTWMSPETCALPEINRSESKPLIGIKMLFNGWTWTNIQKSKLKVKGPRMNKTSVESMPEKRTVVLSKSATMKKRRRKMKKAGNTVFKVSLPLTKGSVLLERMSFSEDSPPVSHSSISDLIPLPEDCELDCDTGSFALNNTEKTVLCTISQLQQDLYS